MSEMRFTKRLIAVYNYYFKDKGIPHFEDLNDRQLRALNRIAGTYCADAEIFTPPQKH
jgi:hypothetical protein